MSWLTEDLKEIKSFWIEVLTYNNGEIVKTALIITAIMALFTACGTQDKSATESADDKCTANIVGVWTGDKDSLKMNGDLSYSYKGVDGCSSYGTYACPTDGATKGTVLVTIKSATASPYCQQAGNYQIGFEVSNNTLALYQTTAAGKIVQTGSYKK